MPLTYEREVDSYCGRFDGLPEMLTAAKAAEGRMYYMAVNRPEWVGIQVDSAHDWEAVERQARKLPLFDGLNVVQRLIAELSPLIADATPTSVRRKVSFNQTGDGTPDVDRYLSGEQAFFRKDVRQRRPSTRIVSVGMIVSASLDVTPQQIAWKAATLATTVDLLEGAGYACDAYAVFNAANVFDGYPHYGAGCSQFLRVKRAGEAVDVADLLNGMSSWWYRTVVFGMYFGTGPKVRDGLGYPKYFDKLPEALEPYMETRGAQAVMLKQAADRAAAVASIRAALKQVQEYDNTNERAM